MRKRIIPAVAILLSIMFSTSFAHEFIIKPEQLSVEPGHLLPVSVLSAHAFMVSEEIEPIDQVQVSLISDKYEKFCKTLVNVGEEDKGFDRVIESTRFEPVI